MNEPTAAKTAQNVDDDAVLDAHIDAFWKIERGYVGSERDTKMTEFKSSLTRDVRERMVNRIAKQMYANRAENWTIAIATTKEFPNLVVHGHYTYYFPAAKLLDDDE